MAKEIEGKEIKGKEINGKEIEGEEIEGGAETKLTPEKNIVRSQHQTTVNPMPEIESTTPHYPRKIV